MFFEKVHGILESCSGCQTNFDTGLILVHAIHDSRHNSGRIWRQGVSCLEGRGTVKQIQWKKYNAANYSTVIIKQTIIVLIISFLTNMTHDFFAYVSNSFERRLFADVLLFHNQARQSRNEVRPFYSDVSAQGYRCHTLSHSSTKSRFVSLQRLQEL